MALPILANARRHALSRLNQTARSGYLGPAMEGVIEVHPDLIETLHANGLEVPYVQYGQHEPGIKLLYQGEEYWYYRTLPIKGYGAVIARYLREIQAQGKKTLLARFYNRIYIFATGVTPIGAGKPPGG